MDDNGGRVVVPPGIRFYPTEEELVSFYLKNKINGSRTQDMDRVIPQLDVYDFNPSELPQYAGELCHGETEQWFFFLPRQEKEGSGGRACRLTNLGYWKSTGSPTVVYSSSGNRRIGMKRTLVFYYGRAPTGKKTKWKMNEYKVFKDESSSKTRPKVELLQDLSLCRVYITKCARAFDRRPPGTIIRKSRPIQQTSYNDDQSPKPPPNHHLVMERTINSS